MFTQVEKCGNLCLSTIAHVYRSGKALVLFFHPLFTFMQKSKNRRGVFYKVHGTFHDKCLWYSYLAWYSWINRFIWCLPTSWKYISHFAQFTQFALSENPITINAWIGETEKRENGKTDAIFAIRPSTTNWIQMKTALVDCFIQHIVYFMGASEEQHLVIITFVGNKKKEDRHLHKRGVFDC